MATVYYASQYFTTQLSVVGGIDASQTTGIVLQSISGINDTSKPGIALLNYSDPLNESIAEWVKFNSINSTTKELVGVTRGAEKGSGKVHSNGVTIAFPISESHINVLADAVSIGGSATNAIQGFLDEDDMASNSATKGATQQSIKAYVDSVITSGSGWTDSSDTWVYASASSFTIAGVDRTAIFQKGTYLRFKQGGGYKYAVVLSSSFSTNTTVNIFVNTDYTIANASITDNDYSYALNPEGWPTDFTYTPTINGTGGSAGTYAATTYFCKYSVSGRRVHVQIAIVITNKGSWSGQVQCTLPAPASSSYTGTYNNPVNAFLTNEGAVPGAASLAMGSVLQNSNIMQFIDSMGVSLIAWTGVSANFRIHGEFSYLY